MKSKKIALNEITKAYNEMKEAKDFWIKEAGANYHITVEHINISWFEHSTNKKIIFKVQGDNREFVYQWDSTPSLGLATLYADKELIYDPYRREGNDYKMMNIARKTCIQAIRSLTH